MRPDEVLARREHWHRQPLQDMAIAIPEVRPAVIPTELESDLAEFLRFRRVFSNVDG